MPLSTAVVVAALAAPATAQASNDYVVSLKNPADSTCHGAILEVTMSYGIVPRKLYTSAICGFAASLSKPKARELALDPRVESVQPDAVVTAG